MYACMHDGSLSADLAQCGSGTNMTQMMMSSSSSSLYYHLCHVFQEFKAFSDLLQKGEFVAIKNITKMATTIEDESSSSNSGGGVEQSNGEAPMEEDQQEQRPKKPRKPLFPLIPGKSYALDSYPRIQEPNKTKKRFVGSCFL